MSNISKEESETLYRNVLIELRQEQTLIKDDIKLIREFGFSKWDDQVIINRNLHIRIIDHEDIIEALQLGQGQQQSEINSLKLFLVTQSIILLLAIIFILAKL